MGLETGWQDGHPVWFSRVTPHNGFWSGGNHSNSNLAVWFEVNENDEVGSKLYVREGFQPGQKCMASLFDKPALLQS
jgi:hypothetical protein